MVSLIKDGVFTDAALKKILKEIEKTGGMKKSNNT